MFGGQGHETDYHKSKRPDAAHDSATQHDASGESAHTGAWAGLSRLMESSGINARSNEPVRTEVLRGMQQTHGNRAVQRYFAGGEETHDASGYGLPFGLGDLALRGGQALGQLGSAAQEHAFRGIASGATDFAGDVASDVLGGTPLGPMLGIPEKKRGLANLPFGLGGMAEKGEAALGQLGGAAQEYALRSMAGSATDFAGDMASGVLGGTPLGPMLGIPEKKSFLESLPLIGGLAGRGAEMGSSVLSGGMQVIGALGQQELPNTRNTPLPFAGIPFLGAPDIRALLDHGYEMEGGGTGLGWEPDGATGRPYGYAKVNEYGGQEIGAGVGHGAGEIRGVPVTTDALYGVDKQGTFGTDNGDTRYGALQNFGFAKTQFNSGGAISGDMEALTGGYELSAGTDGATANIGYNLAAASISAGQATNQSHNDVQARFGLSAGLSAALRGHWGDKDGDGYNEYGFGGDFLIYSADLKTEDPLGTLARSGASFLPGGDHLYDAYMGDYNLTHGTSMSEDKAAEQEVWNNSWADKMRAEEDDNYDSRMARMPYHIPYQ